MLRQYSVRNNRGRGRDLVAPQLEKLELKTVSSPVEEVAASLSYIKVPAGQEFHRHGIWAPLVEALKNAPEGKAVFMRLKPGTTEQEAKRIVGRIHSSSVGRLARSGGTRRIHIRRSHGPRGGLAGLVIWTSPIKE